MNVDIQSLLLIVMILLLIELMIIAILILKKFEQKKVQSIIKRNNDILIKTVLGQDVNIKKKIPITFCFKLKQSIQLDDVCRERIKKVIDINKAEKLYFNRLNSISKIIRIEAAICLGIIGTEEARIVLEKRLIRKL